MGFLDRLHLIASGEYNLGLRESVVSPDTSSVVPRYSGPGFGVAALADVYRPSNEQQTGPHIRVGLGFRNFFLSTPQDHPASSQVNLWDTSLIAEGLYRLHPNFDIGLRAFVGIQGLSSNNLDIGLPFTATLDATAINAGGCFFMQTWQGAFRASGCLEGNVNNRELSIPSGNLQITSSAPTATISIGLTDGIIRNLAR